MHTTLPMLLTLIRLAAAFIFPVIFYYVLPLHYGWLNMVIAILFLAVSATDYFDGYLARKWHQETELGRIIDPVADKLLVVNALISLAVLSKVHTGVAIFLISREIVISCVREAAVQKGIRIPVSWWGKSKATFQYFYLCTVVGAPWPWMAAVWFEHLTLGGTLLLSGVSAYRYVHSFIKQLQKSSCSTEIDYEI